MEILRGALAHQAEPDLGTMRGATVVYLLRDAFGARDEIAAEGKSERMGQHLQVVVLSREGVSGRDYRPANDDDRAAFHRGVNYWPKPKQKAMSFGDWSECFQLSQMKELPLSELEVSVFDCTALIPGARCSTKGSC